VLEEIFQGGHDMKLEALGEVLAHRRMLVVTATRDDDDAKAIGLLQGARRSGGSATTLLMDTDHGFNDHRVALEAAILRWLASLPGAPTSPIGS
jgi:hypothetical protein